MDISVKGTLDREKINEILNHIKNQKTISTLDLSRVNFVKPYGMIVLLQIISNLQQIERIIFPDYSTLTYMARAGFFDQAKDILDLDREITELNNNIKVSEDNKTLIAINKIQNREDIVSTLSLVHEQTRNILINNLGYKHKDVEDFLVLLSELLDNINRHSGSTGFVSAQSYRYRGSNLKYISVCVSDTGIGIKKSFINNGYQTKLSHKEAIELAVIKEFSSKSINGQRGGNGYKGIKEKVEKLSGGFLVRTGDCQLNVLNKVYEYTTNMPFFLGTQIEITLPEKSLTYI